MTEGRASAGRVRQEILREALRWFPRLVRDAGYFLPQAGIAGRGQPPKAELFTRRNAYRRAVASIEADLLEAFCACGWMERHGAQWVLADTGRAWLRRQQAGAEPFREQHELRVSEHRDVGGVKRPVLVNQGESPIGWLRRRTGRDGKALIEEEQFEAAERLRADFTRAQLMPRVTSAWDGGVSARRSRRAAPGDSAGLSEAALAAKQRVMKALDAVEPELASMLVDVCCLLRGLEDSEKARGWPRRSGKVILQIALSGLARHYGLAGFSGAGGARMRHWGSADFRPTLDGR